MPPAASTSGSDAGRLTALTGVNGAPPNTLRASVHGSPTTPMSPDAATTVTWCAAAARSAACRLATSARVSQFSPPVWPTALIDTMPPWDCASRSEAMAAATAGLT